MTDTVTIDHLAHRGDGVASMNSKPVFIPFTLPGEQVEIERNGERARLVSIVTPSPSRIEPMCRHFGTCGGCALQHLEGGAYRAWKEEQVAAALASRGLEAEISPIVPASPGTRRRAVLTAVRAGGRVLVGYHERMANRLVAITECAVATPRIVSALPDLTRLADRLAPRKGELRLTVLDTTSGLDVAAEGANGKAARDFPGLGRLAAEADFARLSVDGEVVIEIRPPALNFGGAAMVPPPGGFVQASAEAEAAMADAVLKAITGTKRVADLFAGSGTFALRIARDALVHAVEGDKAAIGALDRAWRQAPGLKTITQEVRDLFRSPLRPGELESFDAVVFDPPRAGAKEQVAQLAASAVAHIVAVSCNPATLARDLRILIDGGYRLCSVQPVDQFLFSPHIEVVAHLKRG
ncbi:23S rRNA m(5)U-1939 methyltransferase [Breoghania corrubedonensis]|uniref:23S rRNA m(5)U-1939 methyltransferase n=1 Tax=Breoghania corrubedonensis TaxID=665038 RepID=A0A2T5VEK1_9HYPH|nr:class I SAM-dependent RNA methyltransferase [Breoghania corrubedonensis]PTW62177.1 23S rRNA m(5)U-1939 methyltransferase [Breoghania corrubedonensis]